MATARVLPVAMLVLAAALIAMWFLDRPKLAFVGEADSTQANDMADEQPWGPLNWFHNDVIIASHKTYPLVLMIGFCGYGNVLLRKECGDKPYPNWLFGYPICFIAYCYAGATASDIMFVPASLRAMSSNMVFCVFTAWYIIIQNSETVYRFCLQKHNFIFLTTWWLCDATRASLCFLERSVSPPWVAHQKAVFCRGVWQCFIWCAAGPILRVTDRAIRGEPLPKLDALQPNSLNILKFPLVCMFWNMMFYMVYLWKFTDCELFSDSPHSKSMVQCGVEHPEIYAACTYVPCLLHLGRAYHQLYFGSGKMVFGDTFCMGACHSRG